MTEWLAVGTAGLEGLLGTDGAPDRPEVDRVFAVVLDDGGADGGDEGGEEEGEG